MRKRNFWAAAAVLIIAAAGGCENGSEGTAPQTDQAEAARTPTPEPGQDPQQAPKSVYAPDGLDGATVAIKPVGKALISVVDGYPVRIYEGAPAGDYRQALLKPGDYVLHVGNTEADQGLNLELHGEPGEYYALPLTYVVDGELFWTPVIAKGAPNGRIVADKDGLLVGKTQKEAVAVLTAGAKAAMERQAQATARNTGATAQDKAKQAQAEKEAEEKVKALFDKSVNAYEAERYPDALQALDEALTIAPNFDSALVLRGAVLARMKKPEPALESLEKGITVGRNTRGADDEWLHWPYMEKGLILLAVRQPVKAYEAFGASIRAKPTPQALLARANLAFAQGRALGSKDDWDGAEPFFRQAQADAEMGLELEPESAQFWSIKTGTHIMLNEHERACSAMRKACEAGNCSILEEYPQCKPGGS
jgi:tetratricopeptide (TPR) repeat protein